MRKNDHVRHVRERKWRKLQQLRRSRPASFEPLEDRRLLAYDVYGPPLSAELFGLATDIGSTTMRTFGNDGEGEGGDPCLWMPTVSQAQNDEFSVWHDTTNGNFGGIPGSPGGPTSVVNNDTMTAYAITGFSVARVTTSEPDIGDLALNADGTFEYTPPAGWTGVWGFAYELTVQSLCGTSTSTAFVTLYVVNDNPVAGDDTYWVWHDTADNEVGNIRTNDWDYDPLVLSIVVGPQHGVAVLNANGDLKYTPEPHFAGTDTLTYQVFDGAASSTAVVTFKVDNDFPVAVNDPLGDAPTSREFVFPNSPWAMMSSGGYYGGGYGGGGYGPGLEPTPSSNAYTVTNDGIWEISSGNASGSEYDFAIAVPGVLANDVDNDPLTVSIVECPARGDVQLLPGGAFRYEPDGDYLGPDSFTYRVFDGQRYGEATVSLNVVGTQGPPRVDSLGFTEGIESEFAGRFADELIVGNCGSRVHSGVRAAFLPHTGDDYLITPPTAPVSFAGEAFGQTVSAVWDPATDTVTLDQAQVLQRMSPNGNVADPFAAGAFYSDDNGRYLRLVRNQVEHGDYVTYTIGAMYLDASDIELRIDWGDDTEIRIIDPSVNWLAAFGESSGPFVEFRESHTYIDDGWYPVSARLFAGDVAITGLNRTAIVANAGLNVSRSWNSSGEEGLPLNREIGWFRNGNPLEGIDTHLFAIEWGDGWITHGDNGQWWNSSPTLPYSQLSEEIELTYDDFTDTYRMTGQHVYAQDGWYEIRISVVEEEGVVATDVNGFLVDNRPPDGISDEYSVSHRGQLVAYANQAPWGVLHNDHDVASDQPLTASLVAGPSHGTLGFSSNGAFQYTPQLGYSGLDSFVYRPHDDDDFGDPTTVTIKVTNDTPVAVADAYTVSHDRVTALALLANDFDADDDPLTPQIVSSTEHGELRVRPNGDVEYTPAFGYLGPDSFTYSVTDGHSVSNLVTVTLDVVNHAPNGADDNYLVIHERTFRGSVLLNDTDQDVEPLTAQLVVEPSNGLLTLKSNGEFVYSPDPGFLGDDSFTYRAVDAFTTSTVVHVTLHVVNRIPEPIDETHTLSHARVLEGEIPSIDMDGDALRVILANNVDHGRLELKQDGGFVYTPNEWYLGDDSFTYSLTDGLLESTMATVTIHVVNSDPVGASDAYTVAHDRQLEVAAPGVLANDDDADGDELTATLLSTTKHGQLLFDQDGSFTYVPDARFVGVDEFVYMASDDGRGFAPVYVTIDVTQAFSVAHDATFGRHPHDQTLVGNLNHSATDADDDELTFELLSPPAMGTLRLHADGQFAYSPPPGATENVQFTYRVFDGLNYSAPATVSINVTEGAPSANSDFFVVLHDGELTRNVLQNDVDPERTATTVEPLSAQILSRPAHGRIAFDSSGDFTYVPDAGYYGVDTFTYRIFDGRLWSEPAVVSIEVRETAPVAVNDVYSFRHDSTFQTSADKNYPIVAQRPVTANDQDGELDDFTLLLVDPASGLPVSSQSLGLPGELTWNENGAFSFVPHTHFVGEVVFHYRPTDGLLTGNIAQVKLIVTQSPPVAFPDQFTIGRGQTLSVRPATQGMPSPHDISANDADADSDPLVHELLDPRTLQPASPEQLGLHGALAWNANGSFQYTSDWAWSGTELLAYRLFDGMNYSEPALVSIVVTQSAPVAGSDRLTLAHDQPFPPYGPNLLAPPWLLANDADADGDALMAQLVDAVGAPITVEQVGLVGELTWMGNGDFRYTPAPGWVGVESFHYRLFDGLAYSQIATVVIDVTNASPIAVDDQYRIRPGASLFAPAAANTYRPHVRVNDTDKEQDATVVSWASAVEHGTLEWNANGSFRYTPNPGFRGVDGFRYRLSDGIQESDLAQVTFNVRNAAPIGIDDQFTLSRGEVGIKSVVYNDHDPDFDALTASLVDPVSGEPVSVDQLDLHGELTWDGIGGFRYGPDSDFFGTVQFAYRLSDGLDESGVVHVTIRVLEETTNRPPVGLPDSLSISPGHELVVAAKDHWDGDSLRTPILFNDKDLAGKPLTAVLFEDAAHGQLTLHPDGSLVYRPDDNFQGTDQFRYRPFDGIDYGEPTLVTIEVVNYAPTARSGSLQVDHDRPLDTAAVSSTGWSTNRGLDALATDRHRDPLTFEIVSGPAHGTLLLRSHGDFVYTPEAGYVGHDAFMYHASDGSLWSDAATIDIKVGNTRPLATGRTFTVGSDSALSANLPPADSPDGDSVVADRVGGPFFGTLALDPAGSFVYTPEPGFVGTDTFTYVWRDTGPEGNANLNQGLESNFARIVIQVASRAPTAMDDHFSFGFLSGPAYHGSVLANDTDADGDALSALLVDAPTQGTVTLAPDGSFSYIPGVTGFYGIDRFTYIATDGLLDSLLATVTIAIEPLSVESLESEIAVEERAAFTLPVATFQTAIVGATAESFTATIDWGDGTTSSAGQIVAQEDGLLVSGGHTYAKDGVYVATVRVRHPDGASQSDTFTVNVADAVPAFQTPVLSAIKGTPFSTTLATLVDDPDADPADYQVTIDWGNGRQSPGYVQRGNGVLEVHQGHLYDKSGTYPIIITVVDPDGDTSRIETSVTVRHQVLVGSSSAYIVSGRTMSGVIASFTSDSPVAQASHFVATLDWGDGTQTPGMIVGQNGSFAIQGEHTYAQTGSYRINAIVTEDDPAIAVVTIGNRASAIPELPLRFFGKDLTATEGQALASDTVVIEFTDPDPEAQASDYTAVISWGGNAGTSDGQVVEVGGRFQVKGGQTYRQEGAFPIGVELRKNAQSAIGQSAVMVAGVPLTGVGLTVQAPRGNALLARFTDPNPNASQAEYSALLDFGGGRIYGTYVSPTVPVELEILQEGRAGTSSLPPRSEIQMISINSFPTGGTFTLSFGAGTTAPLAYNATSGEIEAALELLPDIADVVVTGSPGGPFTVEFQGAQANKNVESIQANGAGLTGRSNQFDVRAHISDAMTGTVAVRISERNEGRLTLTSTISPSSSSAGPTSADAHPPLNPPPLGTSHMQVFEPQGLTIHTVENNAFNGAVAKLSGDATGWLARINWGDGEITDGTISGGEVQGSHVYAKAGAYRIAVALRKADPSVVSNPTPGINDWSFYRYGLGGYAPWDFWYSNPSLPWNDYGWYYNPWDYGWFGGLPANYWNWRGVWYSGIVSGAFVDAAALSASAAPPLTSVANQPLDDVVLAEVTAGDHALAVVEWGDGKVSEAVIAAGQVRGSHAYEQPGFYQARVTIRDGAELRIVTLPVEIAPDKPWSDSLSATAPDPIAGTEDVALVDVVVARIDDQNPRHIGGLQVATIHWGDGASSPAQLVPTSATQFDIRGTHTYRDAGAYDIRVDFQDQADQLEVHVTALIDAPSFSVTAFDLEAALGNDLSNIVVAEFTVSGLTSERTARDFRAMIEWGDGVANAGHIVLVDDKFLVYGSHSYQSGGDFTVTVMVEDGPVATRSQRDEGTVEVGLTYEGAPPIDVFAGMAGTRSVDFDNMAQCQDTYQAHYQYSGDWSWVTSAPNFTFQVNTGSASVATNHYHGICDFEETINWGEGNDSTLERNTSYVTANTVGTAGSGSLWAWSEGRRLFGMSDAQQGWWSGDGIWSPTSAATPWYDTSWGRVVYPWVGSYLWGRFSPFGLSYPWGGYSPWGNYGWEGLLGWNGLYSWDGLYTGMGSFGWNGAYAWNNYYPWGGTYWWGGYQPLGYDGAGDDTFAGTFSGSYGSSYDNPGGNSWSEDASWNVQYTNQQWSASWNSDWEDYGNYNQDAGTASWNSQFQAYHFDGAGNPYHAYENRGLFDLSTTFGLNRQIRVSEAMIQDTDILPTLFGVEDGPTSISTLAIFQDSKWGFTSGEWTAQIDWGDGVASSVSASETPDLRMVIDATHVYAEEGVYPVTIVLSASGGSGMRRVLTTRASIHDDQLAVAARHIQAQKGIETGEVVVAVLDDFSGDPARFSASIDWGDKGIGDASEEVGASAGPNRHLSKGRLALNSATGKFEVLGEHKYLATGEFKLRVMVADHGEFPLVSQGLAIVGDEWELTAANRTNGFGEGVTQKIGEAWVSLNTGTVTLVHDFDFDLSPGRDVGRNPALVYNSDTAHVRPIVEGRLASGVAAAVSSLEVQLTWGTRDPQPWQVFTIPASDSSDGYLFAVQVATPVEQSGLYPWTLKTRLHVPGASEPVEMQSSGVASVIVNDSGDLKPGDPFDSRHPYGAGWNFQGIDRLIIHENGDLLWVAGDGALHPYYKKTDEDGYTNAKNDYGVMEFREQEHDFRYQSKDRTEFLFNRLGLLVRVTEPGRPPTQYEYDNEGRLSRVDTPDLGATTFSYANAPQGLLVSISEPGNRQATFTYNSLDLQLIHDVDGTSRGFVYGGGHRVIEQTWDPLQQTFAYDGAERVALVNLGLGSAYAVHSLAVQGLGLGGNVAANAAESRAGVIDPLGRTADFKLDDAGRPLDSRETDGDTNDPTLERKWTRDEHHNVTRYEGPDGKIEYEYDAFGDPTKVVRNSHSCSVAGTEACSTTNTFSNYDATYHQPGAITDAEGRTTTMTYDSSTGLLSSVTDGKFGGVLAMTFASGLLSGTVDQRGNPTTFEYDGNRRRKRVTAADGGVTVYDYDGRGNVESVTDPRGFTTTYGYDAKNRLVRITDPYNNSSYIEYSAAGYETERRDELGVRTVYVYDQRGFRTETREAVGAPVARVSTKGYDAVGNVVLEVDPLLRHTTFVYDTRDRLVQKIDPLLRSSYYVYNESDQLLAETDGAGRTTHYEYDEFGNRVTVIGPMGITTRYVYDKTGELLSVTDPLSRTTTYAYDPNLRRRTVTDATGVTVVTDYDAAGNVSAETNGRGYTTRYVYDNMNRLATQIDAQQNTRSYAYDLAGNLTLSLDELFHPTVYEYDKLNRKVAEHSLLGASTWYAYDKVGNLVSTKDARNFVTTAAYDALHRVVGRTDKNGFPTTFTYDAADRLVSETNKAGAPTAYFYDDGDRLIQTTNALDQHRDYLYNAADQLVVETDELGRQTVSTYDAYDRKLTERRLLPASASWVETRYEYDAVGNLRRKVDERNNSTWYDYDDVNRLMIATDAAGGAKRYEYDNAGNVSREWDELDRVTTYAYDPLNRRVSTTTGIGTEHIVYDAAGNVAAKTDANNNPTFYVYDALNRLAFETNALASTKAYEYDLTGNLVTEFDELGHPTLYAYDGQGQVVQQTNALGGFRYYGYDGLGNIISVTDERNQTTLYAYDLLGRQVSETNALAGQSLTVYDAVGNVLAQRDANQHWTHYFYDDLNRLTLKVDAEGGARSYVYDATGNVVVSIDERSHATHYEYDALNRETKRIDPLLGEFKTFYDAVGNVSETRDELDRSTRYEYDVLDRNVKRINPYNKEFITTYDAVGNVLATKDEQGRETHFEYDALNRGAKRIDALASEFVTAYDAVGNVVGTTDELGHFTQFEYDSLHRNTKRIDGPNKEFLTAYDATGNVVSTTDELGRETNYEYDALGRQTKRIDPFNQEFITTYDPVGNVVSTRDELNNLTQFQYDNVNRQTKRVDPALQEFVTDYDAAGNVVLTRNELNHATAFEYDALNRLVTRTDALLGATVTTYDAVGNRASFTDPAGNTTHWTYDLLDRPVSETNELAQTRGFQYDDVGQVERMVNRNGMAVEYDYDALRRRTAERWLVGTTVVRTIDYGYDLASRLVSIVDAGATLSFTYDALGRVVAATETLAGLSTPMNYAFTFDEAGNRQSLALAIGGVADLVNEYRYDDLNRLTRVSQGPQPGGAPVAEKRVDIAYTDAGQFDTLARYADLAGTELAATSQYAWDDRSRLVSLRHAQGTATLAGYDWGFDAAGRLTSFSSLLDGTATYAYDPTDQLVGATYSTTATQPPAQAAETYAYDGNGNRTGAGFVTDANNHTVADGTYTYEYDGEGNRIRRVEVATGIVTEYAWDHRNRLTRVTEKPSATSPPSQYVEFAYDALDRRVSKSIDADADGTVDRVTYFVVDGLRSDNDGAGDHVLLTLTDPDGPSGPAAAAVDHRYLHGPAVDQILADEQVESGSTPPTSRVLWTLTDHQNTVRDLAARDAATGVTTVVAHRQFDSFGEMTAAVNPSDPSASVVDTLFGYTGREFDPETGLAYVRARYYDAALAQFVNEDPLGFAAGDANIRRYVGNHATYAVDPSGLEEATYRKFAQWITPFVLPKALARFEASLLEDAEQGLRARHHERSAEVTSFLRQMAQKVEGLYDSTNALLSYETATGLREQFVGARDKAAVSRKALRESEYSQWSSNCIAACVFLGDLIGSVAIDEAWEGKTFIEEEELTPSQRAMKVVEATEKIANVVMMVLSLKNLVSGGVESWRTSRASTATSHAGGRPTGQVPHPSNHRSPATTAVPEPGPSGNSPRVELPNAESPTHGPPQAPPSSVALEVEQRGIDLRLPDRLTSKGGAGTTEIVAPSSAVARTNAQLVQDVATRADAWGARKGLGSGPVAGTLKHDYADLLLTRYQRMFGDRGLSTEVRYLNGVEWQPGMPLRGSIRLDVVEGPLNNPTWVWDYKFGGAQLTPARINQIRAGAGLGPNVPVDVVRP